MILSVSVSDILELLLEYSLSEVVSGAGRGRSKSSAMKISSIKFITWIFYFLAQDRRNNITDLDLCVKSLKWKLHLMQGKLFNSFISRFFSMRF